MWKHKSFILLGSAILIALVTTVLIVRVLQKKAFDKERASIETQPIAVAMADLSWGTSLTKDMVKVIPFPKDYVPPGCFSSAEKLAGRVLVYPVKMNEPIFESRLAPQTIQAGGVAALISPKKRAVAVKVDKVIGVSGFIHAGNRVDVLVTLDTLGKSSDPVTKIVLENILVLAVGPDVEKKGKDHVPVDVITLEVAPEEAEKLALSASEGKVQLALRNFNDTEDIYTQGTTVSSLLASYSGGTAERKTAAASRTTKGIRASGSASAATSSSARHSGTVVELIKGSKVQEVTF